MKRRIVLGLVVALSIAATVVAQHYTPPAVVVAPAAVVPYYGATFSAEKGVGPTEFRELVESIAEIKADQKRILAALEQRGDIPPLAKKLTALDVTKARCIACHTPGTADRKGGGFVLLADDAGSSLAPLSGNGKTRVREAVESGHMPPSGKLGAEERAAFKW